MTNIIPPKKLECRIKQRELSEKNFEKKIRKGTIKIIKLTSENIKRLNKIIETRDEQDDNEYYKKIADTNQYIPKNDFTGNKIYFRKNSNN